MRLRNRPWAKPLIEENPQYVVTSPEEFKGKWDTRFEKEAPLFIEIGMGKGQFIVEMARQHPENNYIGMELQTVATGYALKKQLENKLPNLQLVRANGAALTEYFEKDEVDGIYLNFSDPWPKKRQAKRRLTYPTFLKQYQSVMKKQGHIEFKTDNRGLFEYSIVSMNNFGMEFDQIWLDLHATPDLTGNVLTEYEEKFRKKGPIYKLEAHFK